MSIVPGPTITQIREAREARRKVTRNRARDAYRAAGGLDLGNEARNRARRINDRGFIGVDGEGIGDGSAHKYVLLGVGSNQIEDRNGLGLEDIFSFLWRQYLSNPDSVFAGFYLGYDFDQWFKMLPRERAWRLLTNKGSATRQEKCIPKRDHSR